MVNRGEMALALDVPSLVFGNTRNDQTFHVLEKKFLTEECNDLKVTFARHMTILLDHNVSEVRPINWPFIIYIYISLDNKVGQRKTEEVENFPKSAPKWCHSCLVLSVNI